MTDEAFVNIASHLETMAQRQPYSQAVADGVSAWAAVEKDRLGLSIKSAITTKLQIFASPRIAAATNATDFDLRDLRHQRGCGPLIFASLSLADLFRGCETDGPQRQRRRGEGAAVERRGGHCAPETVKRARSPGCGHFRDGLIIGMKCSRARAKA